MEHLPKVEQSYKEIWDMCFGPMKGKILATAIELGLFNALSEPVSAETASTAIGAHPRNTGLLMDGLAAMDLVEKKNGLYRNSPIAEAFLDEASPTCMARVFKYLLKYEAFPGDDMLNLVKEGPDSPENPHAGSDEMAEDEVATYIPMQRSGRAQKMAEIASALPEFPSFRKMLDLGCGPGINGIAIVSAHPTLRGVSFDRPRTVAVAAQSIREYGMEDRMETIGGDYTSDPIGEEYDLIFACDTLYYTRDEIDPIMSKLYDALNPGGVLITIDHGLACERTKPEEMIMGTLNIALKGETYLQDKGFLADAMIRAGFKSVRSRTFNTDWGENDLDIGRK
jgi:predicted O-methyltransferase YrrM